MNLITLLNTIDGLEYITIMHYNSRKTIYEGVSTYADGKCIDHFDADVVTIYTRSGNIVIEICD